MEIQEQDKLIDVFIERPYSFTTKKHRYYLYPLTLGVLYLISPHLRRMEIDNGKPIANIYVALLRAVMQHREDCIRVITYITLHGRKDMFDYERVERRYTRLDKELENEDVVSLLAILLSQFNVTELLATLGIDKEQDRMRQLAHIKAKGNKNSFAVGGVTIYGQLIDKVCERYGWTMQYVLWEISYANIQLLLADSVTEMYFSDEERKRIPASVLSRNEEVIRADDKANMKKIRSMGWK